MATFRETLLKSVAGFHPWAVICWPLFTISSRRKKLLNFSRKFLALKIEEQEEKRTHEGWGLVGCITTRWTIEFWASSGLVMDRESGVLHSMGSQNSGQLRGPNLVLPQLLVHISQLLNLAFSFWRWRHLFWLEDWFCRRDNADTLAFGPLDSKRLLLPLSELPALLCDNLSCLSCSLPWISYLKWLFSWC